MSVRRSHVLAQLAKLTSKKVKWKWGTVESQAFQAMQKLISKHTLLAFPDFTKPFFIHTDASYTQLGAVISQDDKPITFYSRKLNSAQKKDTTGEQELLSIEEGVLKYSPGPTNHSSY